MRKNSGVVAEKKRADKKVDCYPTLNGEVITQLTSLAELTGHTKTAFAGKAAHWALWNHAAIDQLQPYFQHMVSLEWDANEYSNCFHAWIPSHDARDIRPVIEWEQGQEGQRFKFRITQEDRRRLQVIAYALNITSADSLWPVLLPLVLLDARSLYAVTQSRDAVVSGFHPLRQEWLSVKAEGTWRE